MSLCQLPPELQTLVAEHLSEGDLNALARTSHHFHSIANPLLYLYNVKYSHRSCLFWAALKGNQPTVRLAMAAGADISASRPNGMTPLLQAVTCHQEAMVRMLLQLGAVPSDDDTNPLAMAALIGSVGITRLLLDYGTNVNTLDECHRTPLSYAAEIGHLTCIRMLIDAGADVNMVDERENPPLHYAEMYGMSDAVDVLLAAGAEVVPLEAGRTPLSVAAEREYRRTVDVILSKPSEIEGMDSSGETPLHWAVLNQNWHIIRALINAGYHPAAKNSNNVMVVDLVASNPPTAVREFLMKYIT